MSASPSSAAWQVLGCLRRVKSDLQENGNAALVELLHAWALDTFAKPFSESTPHASIRKMYDGATGPLQAAEPKSLAVRRRGLGAAHIQADGRARTRATAAEHLTEIWGELLGAAPEVQRLFSAALGVLFKDSNAFPPWHGADPDRFRWVVWSALTGTTDGISDVSIVEGAARLRENEQWQLALNSVDRKRLAKEVGKVLSCDLDAVEAEWKLENESDPVAPPPAPQQANGEGGANPPAVKGKRINERMLATLQGKLESLDWSAQQWADALECSKSTVMGTQTWRTTIRAAQATERAGRELQGKGKGGRRRTN